jgi:DNA integrity scanning protein DisA with diadenylate cyclase activity
VKEMINGMLGIGSEYMFENICKIVPYCEPNVLEHTIQLAVEIAREGREGRKIGTMFVLGDEEITLEESRPLILDPLLGHSQASKGIQDTNMRETAKELAQLDGAFIISWGGVVISAARYINSDAKGINLPLGLGSRHVAAAAITRRTKSIAVVVSESSVVRVFSQGQIVAEIIPEIWMLTQESIQVQGPYTEAKVGDLQIYACELPKDG